MPARKPVGAASPPWEGPYSIAPVKPAPPPPPSGGFFGLGAGVSVGIPGQRPAAPPAPSPPPPPVPATPGPTRPLLNRPVTLPPPGHQWDIGNTFYQLSYAADTNPNAGWASTMQQGATAIARLLTLLDGVAEDYAAHLVERGLPAGDPPPSVVRARAEIESYRKKIGDLPKASEG